MNLLLISLFTCQGAFAIEGLPKWITTMQLSSPTHYFVICSADGFDPDEVKQLAEAKCLASAAKLGGATVTVRQKTVQSLTGSDSSEVAEMQPITKKVECVWIDRFMENIQNGVRIWLRCKVDRGAVHGARTETGNIQSTGEPTPPKKYKRALLNLVSVPVADRILVLTSEGERTVIEVKSNVEQIELHEGDISVVIRKQKFRDANIDLGAWVNGDLVNRTVYLKPEL